MYNRYMILPAKDHHDIKLVLIPEDYEEHEVFRHVTGVIAEVEEKNASYVWDDIAAALEDHGFTVVDYILGPVID